MKTNIKNYIIGLLAIAVVIALILGSNGRPTVETASAEVPPEAKSLAEGIQRKETKWKENTTLLETLQKENTLISAAAKANEIKLCAEFGLKYERGQGATFGKLTPAKVQGVDCPLK